MSEHVNEHKTSLYCCIIVLKNQFWQFSRSSTIWQQNWDLLCSRTLFEKNKLWTCPIVRTMNYGNHTLMVVRYPSWQPHTNGGQIPTIGCKIRLVHHMQNYWKQYTALNFHLNKKLGENLIYSSYANSKVVHLS